MTYAPPSSNPADLDSLAGTFDLILEKFSQNIDGMLPAKVIGYTAGPPAMVSVQPLIAVVTTIGEVITRAQIASIPVLQLGGGGFVLHFPVQIGDLGWILSTDRDISNFLNTYTEATPNTSRKKDFSSALFVPDAMKNYTLASEDNASVVLQSINGTVKVSLSGTIATVSAPTVNVIADTVNLGSVAGSGVARIGDSVNPDTFLIQSGSSVVFSG